MDFERLAAWVRDARPEVAQCNVREAVFPAVDARGTAFEMRGLAAARTIAAGDTVLCVPSDCFVCLPNALRRLPVLAQLQSIMRRYEAPDDDAPAGTSDTSSSSEADADVSDAVKARRRRLREVATRRARAALDAKRKADTDLVRGLAEDDEFLLSVALILWRFDGRFNVAGSDPFSDFVRTLPGPHELTNVDMWSAAEVELLGSSLRRGKAQRRLETKLPQRFAQLQRLVFPLLRDAFDAMVFTAERWWWAVHTLGSRCFSYTPKLDAASIEGKRRSKHQRRRRARLMSRGRKPASSASRLSEFRRAASNADDDSSSTSASTVATDSDSDRSSAAESGSDGGEESTSSETTSSSSSDSDEDAAGNDDETFTMVPLADLCNHDDDERATCDFEYDPTVDAMVFKARNAYKEGDEVFIRYNGMDSWKFAKYYGFVPTAFKELADVFPIQVPALPGPQSDAPAGASYATLHAVGDDIALATKRQLFSEAGGGAKLVAHCHITAKGPNSKLLGVMRLRYMAREEMNNYPRAFLEPPLSPKNEFTVYSKLVELIDIQLKEIRAAIAADDESAGADQPAAIKSLRACVARCVRSRDKEILERARAVCKLKANECAETLYYGSTKEVVARRAVLEEQLQRLRATGKDPAKYLGRSDAGLGSTVEEETKAALQEAAPAWRSRVAPS